MREPDWEAEGHKLYLGDCLDILPELEGVDAVVTDPPFNAGREGIENDSLSLAEWRLFCRRFASCCLAENILIETGKNDLEMRAAFDSRHRYRWAIVLNYTNAMRQGAVGYSNTGLVYWYGEGRCYSRYMDRIDAPLENTKGLFSHPTPKTTAHYTKLVEMFSEQNQTILDPFTGSGTTGVACVNLDRKFIGIEKEPKYFEIAVKRMEQAIRDKKSHLPFMREPQPVQKELIA